jgi:hypothetical protein
VNPAVAEALADPRVGAVSAAELEAEAARWDLVADTEADDLDAFRRGRPIEWATRTLTQGQVLDEFADHCRRELDDVELLERRPSLLDLGWRRERTSVELRAGFLFCERLPGSGSALLLGVIGPLLVDRFLDDAALRSQVAVVDLARLEKISAARSSVFVYFEWFLRDRYGVRLMASSAFTEGLVGRGIISLGMG